MKRQQRTIGAFVIIPLENGEYAYARILDKASFAIYDFISKNKINDLNQIINKPILFIVAVYNDAVTHGRWEKIGKLPLEEKFKILPMNFIEDGLIPGVFSLYDPNTGETYPADKSKCMGLERTAVWEPEHVESRILDHYAGLPNPVFERLKIK